MHKVLVARWIEYTFITCNAGQYGGTGRVRTSLDYDDKAKGLTDLNRTNVGAKVL